MAEPEGYAPALFWDHLHAQPRFRPLYPSEHVVRFLARSFPPRENGSQVYKALDIGVGGGRHMRLLGEMGFEAYGTDISMIGLKHTLERAGDGGWRGRLGQALMDELPLFPEAFDVVIGSGVFFYGTETDMRTAIKEVHRVLKTGGKAFVILRTTGDYRFGKGRPVGANTFSLDIRETNEYRTIQHFLSEGAVLEYFSLFSRTEFEKAETTFGGRRGVNSEWLVTAEK